MAGRKQTPRAPDSIPYQGLQPGTALPAPGPPSCPPPGSPFGLNRRPAMVHGKPAPPLPLLLARKWEGRRVCVAEAVLGGELNPVKERSGDLLNTLRRVRRAHLPQRKRGFSTTWRCLPRTPARPHPFFPASIIRYAPTSCQALS